MKHKAVRLDVSAQTLCGSMFAAFQAPLSMEFSRQEYWSGLPFSTPGALPDPGIKPVSPALAGECLTTEHRGSPYVLSHTCIYIYAHSCVLFIYSLCVSLSYRQCLRYTDGFESLTTDFSSRLFGYNFHNFNMLKGYNFNMPKPITGKGN